MSSCGDALLQRITSKEATIGIIGMGYVGLPLAIAFGEAGCRVLGFDLDNAKANDINAGRSYIEHIEGDRVAALAGNGTLSATADMDRLGEPDAVLICVPTPLNRHLEPDLDYVLSTTRSIARRLRPGQIVILESTTYPGTTSGEMLPILEQTGLKVGEDFFLAYSPER